MPSQAERLRRYHERLAGIMSQADDLTEASVRRLMRRLEGLKGSLLKSLAEEKLSEWGTRAAEAHYRKLIARIDEDLKVFRGELTADVMRDMEQLVKAGREAVSGPLASGDYLVFRFRSTIQDMASLYEYVPELIADMTAGARREISRRLRGYMLGTSTAGDLTDWLEAFLSANPERLNLSRFGPLPYQAERIYRTEAMRTLNSSHQLGLRELERSAPSWVTDHVRKWWRHGLAGRLEPREAHVAAERRSKADPLKLDERFAVNGHECYGPHDPSLPASEVIFCGCTLVTTVVMEDAA